MKQAKISPVRRNSTGTTDRLFKARDFPPDFREEQILQIAEMYYQQEIKQEQIAKLVGVSRPSISRLLEEAKRKKFVEIIIHSKVQKNSALSCQVRECFGLKTCTVSAGNGPYPVMLKKCVQAAGDFFHSVLQNGMTVTISWGTAMNLFADLLEAKPYHNVHIAQAVGCLSTGNPKQDGIETARKIAEKLGATYSNIYAPVFVESPLVRDYFLKETQIIIAMKKALSADMILTGIGSIGDKESILSVTNYISTEEWEQLRKKGGTTHLMGHMIDREGNEIVLENKHLISVPLKNLKEVNLSIGISASPEKAESVFTAINSGYINALFIDEELAKNLLELYAGKKQTETGNEFND